MPNENQIIKEQKAKLRADLAERLYNVSEPVSIFRVLTEVSDCKSQSKNGRTFQRLNGSEVQS